MNGKKVSAYLLGVMISVALFVVLVLTSFELVAFDENFYAREQQLLKLDKVTGISQTELNAVTHKLLNYCKGKDKMLNVQATVNGEYREVYNGKEKTHMIDVQKLFIAGFDIRNGCLLAVLLLTTILVSVARRDIYRILARSWLFTIAVLGVAAVALGIYIMTDFEKAFWQFHQLFFTNNLWLLDPDTDILIQMLPENFFFALVRRIVLFAASTLLTTTAAAVAVLLVCRLRPAKPHAEVEPEPDDVVPN